MGSKGWGHPRRWCAAVHRSLKPGGSFWAGDVVTGALHTPGVGLRLQDRHGSHRQEDLQGRAARKTPEEVDRGGS